MKGSQTSWWCTRRSFSMIVSHEPCCRGNRRRVKLRVRWKSGMRLRARTSWLCRSPNKSDCLLDRAINGPRRLADLARRAIQISDGIIWQITSYLLPCRNKMGTRGSDNSQWRLRTVIFANDSNTPWTPVDSTLGKSTQEVAKMNNVSISRDRSITSTKYRRYRRPLEVIWCDYRPWVGIAPSNDRMRRQSHEAPTQHNEECCMSSLSSHISIRTGRKTQSHINKTSDWRGRDVWRVRAEFQLSACSLRRDATGVRSRD